MEPVDLTGALLVESAPPARPRKGDQTYENTALAGSSAEQEYFESPDRLFNDKTPNLGVVHEKHEHRMAIMMAASGMSRKEICERTGYSYAHLCQVLRQPWARERLIEEIRRNGGDEIMAVLRAEQLRSIETVIEVRDSPIAKPSDRAAAANSILDRYLGKATQRIESKQEVTHISGDIDNIERELAELEREERRLRGAAPDVVPAADGTTTVKT